MFMHEPEKLMFKKGYIKLAKDIYAFGEIVEYGISGAAGWYALVEWFTKTGKQCKTAIYIVIIH